MQIDRPVLCDDSSGIGTLYNAGPTELSVSRFVIAAHRNSCFVNADLPVVEGADRSHLNEPLSGFAKFRL